MGGGNTKTGVVLLLIRSVETPQVYTVSVSPSFSLEAPCNREGPLRGDVTVSFTCDPDSASRLIDAVLDTVRKLQVLGTNPPSSLLVFRIVF